MLAIGLDGLCVFYPKLSGNIVRLVSEPLPQDQVEAREIVLITYDRYFRST